MAGKGTLILIGEERITREAKAAAAKRMPAEGEPAPEFVAGFLKGLYEDEMREATETWTAMSAGLEKRLAELASEAGARSADWGFTMLRGWQATLVVLLIAVSEVGFNTVVFNMLGEERLLTLIIASGISFGMPWAADVSGKMYRRRAGKFGLVIMSALAAGGLGVLLAIAISRVRYIENNPVSAQLTMGLSPTTLLWIFLALNIFLLIVSFAVGALSESIQGKIKTLARQHQEQWERCRDRAERARIAFGSAAGLYKSVNDLEQGVRRDWEIPEIKLPEPLRAYTPWSMSNADAVPSDKSVAAPAVIAAPEED